MDADIIVIGASPAGLMAARNAAQKGRSVILLDKKEATGVPPHPANTFFKGMFLRSGEKVDPSYVIKTMRGAHIIAPSGREVIFEGESYFLDRKKFDEFYAKQVTQAGVQLRMGVEVHNVLRTGDSFTLSTSKGKLQCRLIIVSDGINSKISALLGLKPLKYPEDIAWAMEAEVEAEGIGEPDLFEYYVGNHAPGWKSTYSPCGGDRATLGVYVRRHGRDMSDFFDDWVSRFKAIKGIEHLKIISTSVGGDPIAAIPGDIVADGIMVVGGSAGQSGIGYAMHAGQMCGDVAADSLTKGDISKNSLSEYRRLWNEAYRTEYYLGRFALETLRKMSDSEINDLMKVFEGEDLKTLGGSPFSQAMQISRMILKNNPSSLLSFRAILRNK